MTRGGPRFAARAVLSVPGDRPERFETAFGSGADAIVLDLEDAVAGTAKDRARAEVVKFLTSRRGDPDGTSLVVRTNPVLGEAGRADLAALAEVVAADPRARPDAVLLPKVEAPDVCAAATELLGGPVPLLALIETARGMADLQRIAGADGLAGLVLGYADLGADLGRALDDPTLWLCIQDAVLIAARSNGLHALDGPWLATADDDDFARAASRSAALGFDGKWVIHPRQVRTVTESFTPAQDRVRWAHRVLDALGRSGVATVEGAMVDEAVAVTARRVLASVRDAP